MSGHVSRETLSISRNVQQQIDQVRQGRRKKVFHSGMLCSKCYEAAPAAGQRYCAECHRQAVADSAERKKAELKRLRALAQQQGQDHG